jgi:hypothetical protein
VLLVVEFLETEKEAEEEVDFDGSVPDDDELFEIEEAVELPVLLEEEAEASVPINEELDDFERLPVVEKLVPDPDVFVLLLELWDTVILDEDVV